ncbi:hypothetical protein M116_0563 [Bacteroides fragilis str. 3719 A10]|nr:hypothetical protein M116_0563 [Bacteroides fragilis str. 3719 A10]
MIHLKDINKTYNNGAPLHVLKGINLDIERGEFVSIMGASGSGKSTLLNIEEFYKLKYCSTVVYMVPRA